MMQRSLFVVVPSAVIHAVTCLSYNHLITPIAARPTGGRAALERDTPGRHAAALDRALEVHQGLPAVGHVVALGLEVLRVVPDQAFDRDPREGLVELAVDRAQVDPALRIVRLQ